ncbi:MAG TPA: lipid-A-disaccharide synthase [Bacteroidales bacterium]|nr:lipid-A-disaccharide synthase [Bacteroidales bacterium]
MKYYLIAGEASGDMHAANLMAALVEKDPKAEFRFLGGDKMAAIGGTPLIHYKKMAYMGILPVILHARTLLRNMRICKKDILSWQPDVLILIDYPGFNLNIAAYIKKKQPGLPIHYYISPKLWAWKGYRIRNIRRDIDRLYSILPFEKTYFDRKNYRVFYVGNPSLDSIEAFKNSKPDLKGWREKQQLTQKPIIALLAGSRRQEIKANLPLMLRVASAYPDHQLVLAGAPGINKDFYAPYIKNYDCRLVYDETYSLLAQSKAALVVSGTATLETALFGVPQVVCYALWIGGFLYKIGRKYLIRTPFISLVNLIAEKEVVVELVANEYNYEQLKNELNKILYDSAYIAEMQEAYGFMRKKLGEPGAAGRTASLIYNHLT